MSAALDMLSYIPVFPAWSRDAWLDHARKETTPNPDSNSQKGSAEALVFWSWELTLD
jgi:hypothetical protein